MAETKITKLGTPGHQWILGYRSKVKVRIRVMVRWLSGRHELCTSIECSSSSLLFTLLLCKYICCIEFCFWWQGHQGEKKTSKIEHIILQHMRASWRRRLRQLLSLEDVMIGALLKEFMQQQSRLADTVCTLHPEKAHCFLAWCWCNNIVSVSFCKLCGWLETLRRTCTVVWARQNRVIESWPSQSMDD